MAEKPIEPDFDVGDILKDLAEEFGPLQGQVRLDPDNCYTSEELATMWNRDVKSIRRKLRKLKARGGLIETTKYVEPLGRPGTLISVPAYQVKRGDEGVEED